MSEEKPGHREVPEGVEQELSAATFEGEPWPGDDADGRTLFDSPASEDGSVTVVFPQEKFDRWRSGALARVHSKEDGRTYLAQVVRGPFAAPIGLAATAPTLVVAQVESALFTPPYHGWAALALLGEVRDGSTHLAMYRPRPNSPVTLLSPEEAREALDCDGDLRLGTAVGHPGLHVGLRSTEKHHVPRHTLVVGTTGAGKSTFLAGWVEKLARAGFCVILLDVEGEYVAMNEPAASGRILPALEARGLAPEGVANTYLLVPANAATRNADHPSLRRFSLRFATLSPHVAVELLQGNEAQSERFLMAYEAAGELVTELRLFADEAAHREALRRWDDQESGYPDLRLAHVLDVAEAAAAAASGEKEVAGRYLHDDGFKAHGGRLMEKGAELKKRLGHNLSWRKTVSLIAALHRSRLFDQEGVGARSGQEVKGLDYAKMLSPGRVLVVDLSGVDAPAHRNLAMADLLRGVMEAQDGLYLEGRQPKTVIVIEEAHELVSAERVKRMPALFEQLQRVARRGRKRWLGLVFASQFPQHLPNELFTLCNNRILLRLGDEPTIRRLQNSVGGVPENLWARLKNLPTGQAIVSGQGVEPAQVVALEPARCRLLMVD